MSKLYHTKQIGYRILLLILVMGIVFSLQLTNVIHFSMSSDGLSNPCHETYFNMEWK